MTIRSSRRTFLQAGPLVLASAGLIGNRLLLGKEPPRQAIAGSGRDLESLIELLFETPAEHRVRVVGEELRRGLSYRELLTGLYLAAVRIESTHPVAMVHSANWVAASLPAKEALLPLIWVWDRIGGGIDVAKRNNEVVVHRTDKPPPPVNKALEIYHAAMAAKDPEAGELAALSLARSIGARQTMELAWQYACRDSDDLGHKAIRLSNSWRTLDFIGWEFAEDPLRYIAARNAWAEPNDTTYESTRQRVVETSQTLPPDWSAITADENATLELYEEIRAARTTEAVRLACEQLSSGRVKSGSLWDAIHLAAGELAVRFNTREGIRGWPVHAVTSTNALHFAFRTVTERQTRLLILLQAVCWVSEKMTGLSLKKDRLRDLRITLLDPTDVASSAVEAVDAVFNLLPGKSDDRSDQDKLDRDRDDLACRSAWTLLKSEGGRRVFRGAANRYLVSKANNSHDYKYTAAAFEDAALISERWRPGFIAATVNVLHGPASADSAVLQQAREELSKL